MRPVIALTRSTDVEQLLAAGVRVAGVEAEADAVEAADAVPQPGQRVEAARHRVLAAGGVLDEHRQRRRHPLERLHPVLDADLGSVALGDVTAVDDQPLRADGRRRGRVVEQDLARRDADLVVRRGDVDDVRRVDVEVEPARRRSASASGTTAFFQLCGSPKKHCTRSAPRAAALGERVGLVDVGTDPQHRLTVAARARQWDTGGVSALPCTARARRGPRGRRPAAACSPPSAGCSSAGGSPRRPRSRSSRITADGVQPQVLDRPAGRHRPLRQRGPELRLPRAEHGAGRGASTADRRRCSPATTPCRAPLTRPGTYAYRVAQDPPYRGTVLVGRRTDGRVRRAAAPAAPSAARRLLPPPSAAATPPSAAARPAPTAAPAAPVRRPARPRWPGALPAPASGRGLGLPTALAGRAGARCRLAAAAAAARRAGARGAPRRRPERLVPGRRGGARW